MFLPLVRQASSSNLSSDSHTRGGTLSPSTTSPLWKRKLGLELGLQASPPLSQSPYIEEDLEEAQEYFAEETAPAATMQLQNDISNGPAPEPQEEQKRATFAHKSSSLPFGQDVSLSAVNSSSYLTALTLVQQVAYTLSDKIFAYSPETFDLDVSLRHWNQEQENNGFGFVPSVKSLETRAGAGSLALGYVTSRDFDLTKRHIPQSIVASSYTLGQLRSTLDQLSLLSALTNPFVCQIAAVDYVDSGLATDYITPLSVADELGLTLIASGSAKEVQHMGLLATVLAKVGPAIHVFDGIQTSRETARFSTTLEQSAVYAAYERIAKSVDATEVKHSDSLGRVLQLLKAFNAELGTDYQPFEYHGAQDAEQILVVFGSVEAVLAKQAVKALSSQGRKVGVINVRIYRPFAEEDFLKALPSSVKNISVLGQVANAAAVADASEHSLLYRDVLAALSFSSSNVAVTDAKYARSDVLTVESVAAKLGGEIASAAAEQNISQYTYWDLSESTATTAPFILAKILSDDTNVTIKTGHDNLVEGGVVRTDLLLSESATEASASQLSEVAFVGSEKLLKAFDVISNLQEEGTLAVKLKGIKDEDLEKKIPVGARQGIAQRKLRLVVIDPTASAKVAENPSLEADMMQLAYLKLAGQDMTDATLQKLASINADRKTIDFLVSELEFVVRPIDVPESWATIEPEADGVHKIVLPSTLNVNSFSRYQPIDYQAPGQTENWHIAAKGLAFKEAYGTKTSLRPDVQVKTAIVHVKERKRLTPMSYDRNIFHIEFDLGTSGVKYAIGEALGIHAENDAKEVEEFIKWYGLNADEIVQVPSREDPEIFEQRTVYQALIQNVDIFGRPPKKFYELLADFASDEAEKKALLTLTIPDGATEFKRRAEVDTITYADLLLEFKSAKPNFHDIVRIVSPMKRREYSIASSQNVTPNSVSLLIVTVNWVDPAGRDRFGQATRYLNSLAVGSPVTVSVKPSVMKLPPLTTAPLIMAGLGTGLAPFRAFVQERAYQKQQGHDIGSVLLYMGSRHQREEYLYGEEWEAYQDAGIITHIGKAFSRDQPHKIYIQDRMRQSLSEIRKAYFEQGGSFYLCGPTWPVPDVTEVLQEAVEVEEKSKGAKKIDSRRAIEELKDDGRFVLEVY